MKKLLLILAFATLACAAPVSAIGSKAYQAVPDLKEYATVISPNGLRLRDLPDSLGSTELTIIPLGGAFEIYYCIEARGTEWAFGVWVDQDSQAWLGYAAARYLSGGCDG